MILPEVPIGREKIILSAEELTHSRINSTFPSAKDNNKSKGQTSFPHFSQAIAVLSLFIVFLHAVLADCSSIWASKCSSGLPLPLEIQSSFPVSSLCISQPYIFFVTAPCPECAPPDFSFPEHAVSWSFPVPARLAPTLTLCLV